MGTPTQYYVDPAIAGNSGAGSVGDPYGDIQHALDTITRDATNGDQINIKAGTDELLAAALSLATYGTPSVSAPLVFRGYTAAANDGGIGGISGQGSVSVFYSTTLVAIHFWDMHLHNTGANIVVRVDDFCTFWNCEIDNSSATGGIRADQYSNVINCYIHNVAGVACWIGTYGQVAGCFIEYGANVPSDGILGTLAGCGTYNNIIKCSGAMDGIEAQAAGWYIANNSIWSNGGTGKGIHDEGLDRIGMVIINNIVEGFIGVGGVGISFGTGSEGLILHSNALYNNTLNLNNLTDLSIADNNDVLGASPFTDPSTNDFTINGTQAGVTEDAFPAAFKGAASTTSLAEKGASQAGAGAGGGMLKAEKRGGKQ